jgi:hypothetical protein
MLQAVGRHLPPDGQTSQELVPQGLSLGNCAQTSVLDLLSVEFQRVLGELEPLGDQSGQFPDPPSLLSKNILGVSSTDDDLGLGVSGSDLTSSVSLLGELTGAVKKQRGKQSYLIMFKCIRLAGSRGE